MNLHPPSTPCLAQSSLPSRAELYGRTDSNLLDLSQVFESLGVSLPDLEEYVEHFQVDESSRLPDQFHSYRLCCSIKLSL